MADWCPCALLALPQQEPRATLVVYKCPLLLTHMQQELRPALGSYLASLPFVGWNRGLPWRFLNMPGSSVEEPCTALGAAELLPSSLVP